MIRVVRQGGVIDAQDTDWGSWFIFPPLPSFEQYMKSIEYFRTVAERDVHGSYHFGRELLALFSEIGPSKITVASPVHLPIVHFGHERFDWVYEWFLFKLDRDGPYGRLPKRMIEDGIIDEQLLLQPRTELERWHENQGAVTSLYSSIFVAGYVE